MKVSEFDFDLPRELIAQYPLEKRDQARLMVIDRQKQAISHDIFANMEKYLPPGSCVVLNDSKVIPARLLGRREKTPGKVEVFLLKKLAHGDGRFYETLIRPLNRLNLNEKIQFNGGSLTVELIDIGKRIVRFNRKDVAAQLKKHGHMPLPPYLDRPAAEIDREVYQTVFAEKEGAVASPTAGLHFDEALLGKLEEKGIEIVYVTLHTSYGTFQSIMDEDFTRHQMMPEDFEITEQAAASINRALAEKRRIIACGTTSTRTLETVFSGTSSIGAVGGKTNLFIYPPYPFKVMSGLITNFHLPKSSLLLLVAAFLSGNEPEKGREKLMRVYNEAIAQGYHFYSYGDAMVIL